MVNLKLRCNECHRRIEAVGEWKEHCEGWNMPYHKAKCKAFLPFWSLLVWDEEDDENYLR